MYVYKLSIVNDDVFLDQIDEDDTNLLLKILSFSIKKSTQRHWAVGISYNETYSQNTLSTRLKISNHDQPMDILPYLLQSGMNSIEIPQ